MYTPHSRDTIPHWQNWAFVHLHSSSFIRFFGSVYASPADDHLNRKGEAPSTTRMYSHEIFLSWMDITSYLHILKEYICYGNVRPMVMCQEVTTNSINHSQLCWYVFWFLILMVFIIPSQKKRIIILFYFTHLEYCILYIKIRVCLKLYSRTW